MRLADCPIRACLNVIGGKWKPIILYNLMDGKKRFGELRRLIPEATQKVLTEQLRQLERDQIVSRTIYSAAALRVEYKFTPAGEALRPALLALCHWDTARRALSRGQD